MEIIDTIWEKRNLGCDSVEIRCTHEDAELDTESILSLRQPYQVIKIPCAKTELLLQAQSLGFMLIECQVLFKTNLNDLRLPSKFERMVRYVSYHEASEKEIEDTLREIRDDNIFTRDRIALDPCFSREIAGKRYANWIQDLLDKNYVMYIHTYKDEYFGWIVANAEEGKSADVLIGGNSQKKMWPGMGIAGQFLAIQLARDKRSTGIHYGVSTNNLRQIKNVIEFGSKIEEIEYVLIKHIDHK